MCNTVAPSGMILYATKDFSTFSEDAQKSLISRKVY